MWQLKKPWPVLKLDSQIEKQYRQHFLKEDILRSVMFMAFLGFLTAAIFVNSFRLAEGGFWPWHLVLLRSSFIFSGIFLAVYFIKKQPPEYEHYVFIWGLYGVALTLFIDLMRPINYSGQILLILVIILLIYLGPPIKLLYMTIEGLLLTAGGLVLIILNAESVVFKLDAIAALFTVNLVGAGVSLYFSAARRSQFAANLHLVQQNTSLEITDRLLKESEEKSRFITDNVFDVVWMLNLKTRKWEFITPSIERLLGYTPEEMLNLKLENILTPETNSRALDLIRERAASFQKNPEEHISYMDEMEQIRKDGTRIWVEIKNSLTVNKQGETVILGVSRDITERKAAEARILETETLKKIDMAKNALLTNVSHELRTPLASIKGFIETLIEPDVKWSKEQQLDFLQSANKEADHLTFLIRDLLDMSRIDSGKMVLDKRLYQPQEILESAGPVLDVIAARHDLKIEMPTDLPPLQADKARLSQVIINLVENATKFSAEGSDITIKVEKIVDNLVISVKDRGEGIPLELQGNLFNRFFQVERVVSGKTRGNGLGLAICKGIVEAHGGKIWAASEPGKGSIFSFSIPGNQ
jgi:PAS domain S-box-containing protein